MENKKISKKIAGISIASLIVILLAAFYFLKLYPVAWVGSTFVSAADLGAIYQLAQKIDSKADKSKVLDQLIEDTKKEMLLNTLRIDSGNFMEQEATFYKSNPEYNSVLAKNFKNSESLFMKYLVEPLALDALLRIKYNSDFSLNNDAYNKATSILNKANQGENFDDLAKTYSEDKVSAQLGGDIGFVGDGEFLPELQTAVEHSTQGQVKKELVISRLGYHVLYPINETTKDGKKIWHIKHILIQTSGYDAWLDKQLQTIGVKKLISI